MNTSVVHDPRPSNVKRPFFITLLAYLVVLTGALYAGMAVPAFILGLCGGADLVSGMLAGLPAFILFALCALRVAFFRSAFSVP